MTGIIRIPLGMVNCYLLHEGRRGILVDAGPPGCTTRLIKALRRHRFSPRNLQLLILTHYHPDHIGAAAELRQRFGVKIAMHPADGHQPFPLFSQGWSGKLLLEVSQQMVKAQSVPEIDLDLQTNFSLAPYGIDGKVIPLPGHTAGSVGVLLANGALLAGDTFFNLWGPRSVPMAEDFRALQKSIARLSQYPIRKIYPGHGPAFAFGRWQRRLTLREAEREED